MKSVGTYIQACRIQRGYTQRELGIMCGYTPRSADATVKSWESGRQNVPITRLRALAQALQVPIEKLVP